MFQTIIVRFKLLIFGGVDSQYIYRTCFDSTNDTPVSPDKLQELLHRCAGAETTSDVARRLATTTQKHLEEQRAAQGPVNQPETPKREMYWARKK